MLDMKIHSTGTQRGPSFFYPPSKNINPLKVSPFSTRNSSWNMSCEFHTCHGDWTHFFRWKNRGRRCHPIVGVLIGHLRIAVFSPLRRLGGLLKATWWFTQHFVFLGDRCGGKHTHFSKHMILTSKNKSQKVSGKGTWRPCDEQSLDLLNNEIQSSFWWSNAWCIHKETALCEKFLQIALPPFFCWVQRNRGLVIQLIGSMNQRIWLWNHEKFVSSRPACVWNVFTVSQNYLFLPASHIHF